MASVTETARGERTWVTSLLIHFPDSVKLTLGLTRRLRAIDKRLNKFHAKNRRELETIVGELEALATCIESRTGGGR